jgi:hypothetical protein
MVRRAYCYCIIFLSLSILFPLTPATPLAAEIEKQDGTAAIPSMPRAERMITIDPGMIYVGDDGGVGLEYKKEFTLRFVGSKNVLSLQVAGMVAVMNGKDSEDYHNGFYTNKLYINGNYIDNLNNYCSQEEDQQFRTISVPIPSLALRPGLNKFSVVATGSKDGNHDDFVLREIKLFQW